MADKEFVSGERIKYWFTSNGARIPVYENETKDMALRRHIVEREAKTKERQIEESKKQAENAQRQTAPYKGKSTDDTDEVIKSLMKNDSINPDHHRDNCAICTTATALTCRGYECEAWTQYSSQHWFEFSDVFWKDGTNPDDYILPGGNSNFGLDSRVLKTRARNAGKEISEDSYLTMPRGAKKVAQVISERLIKWGNGAYGELSVTFPNGNSHSLFIYNNNRVPTIYDSQINKSYIFLEEYFKGTRANNTQLIRLDNAEIRIRDKAQVARFIKFKGGMP